MRVSADAELTLTVTYTYQHEMCTTDTTGLMISAGFSLYPIGSENIY